MRLKEKNRRGAEKKDKNVLALICQSKGIFKKELQSALIEERNKLIRYFFLAFSFSEFSLTLNFTIFFISVSGSFLSKGN